MANCKNCGKSISEYLKDYGFCSNECASEYAGNSTTAPTTTGAPSSTSPSTVPTTDPTTGEEVPRYLANDTYKGHKLSVKPGEVETVVNYLGITLVGELENMKAEIDASKARVKAEAELQPYVAVPDSYTQAYNDADKAITSAQEEVQKAIDKVKNISDAICQYGDGGWATPQSVLKHLNDFLGLTGGGGDDGSGGGGGGGDGLAGDETLEPNETETTIPDETADSGDSDENLNTVDEEIVIPTANGSDEIADGEIITPSTEELEDEDLSSESDISESALSGFSSLIVPSSLSSDEISETKSASLLGALGLAAAAAVALGGKIYYDTKNEDEEDDVEYDESTNASSEEFIHSNNKDMLRMKKKIFNIGNGGDE